MMVKPDDLVIAIDDADRVLDVAESNTILKHLAGHLRAQVDAKGQPSPQAGASESRVIEFYSRTGERLQLVVCDAWRTVAFVPTGRAPEPELLRPRLEAALNQLATRFGGQEYAPQAATWEAFVVATANFLAGDGAQPPDIRDPPDRRNWFHNTFVHGGNP